MPLYRNECETCGHRFRILKLKRMKSAATCPACGSKETRRLLSRVTVQFKGSGYYRTDYKRRGNDSKTNNAQEKKPEEKKPEEKESTSASAAPTDD